MLTARVGLRTLAEGTDDGDSSIRSDAPHSAAGYGGGFGGGRGSGGGGYGAGSDSQYPSSVDGTADAPGALTSRRGSLAFIGGGGGGAGSVLDGSGAEEGEERGDDEDGSGGDEDGEGGFDGRRGYRGTSVGGRSTPASAAGSSPVVRSAAEILQSSRSRSRASAAAAAAAAAMGGPVAPLAVRGSAGGGAGVVTGPRAPLASPSGSVDPGVFDAGAGSPLDSVLSERGEEEEDDDDDEEDEGRRAAVGSHVGAAPLSSPLSRAAHTHGSSFAVNSLADATTPVAHALPPPPHRTHNGPVFGAASGPAAGAPAFAAPQSAPAAFVPPHTEAMRRQQQRLDRVRLLMRGDVGDSEASAPGGVGTPADAVGALEEELGLLAERLKASSQAMHDRLRADNQVRGTAWWCVVGALRRRVVMRCDPRRWLRALFFTIPASLTLPPIPFNFFSSNRCWMRRPPRLTLTWAP
jgi:hypothetical protein